MGLDQYAMIRKPNSAITTQREGQDFAYWRKHNRLEGWMKKLFFQKGGTGVFNWQEVEITLEDLDRLEDAIRNHKLPRAKGRFSGPDSYEYYGCAIYFDSRGTSDEKRDLKFLEDARRALKNGFKVYYKSSW